MPIMLVILIVACFKGVAMIWVVIFVHYTFTIILGAFFSVDMWNVSSPESMHEGTMPPFERKAPRASNGIPRVTSPWMLVVCFLFAEKWERCQDLVRVLPLILVMIPPPCFGLPSCTRRMWNALFLCFPGCTHPSHRVRRMTPHIPEYRRALAGMQSDLDSHSVYRVG